VLRIARERGIMAKRFILPALVATLALCACAGEPVAVARWSKPGADQSAFLAVRDRCVGSVRSQASAFYVAGSRYPGKGGVLGELAGDLGVDTSTEGLDRDQFQRCMNGRGWSADPKGFAPPQGDEVAIGH